MELVEEAIRSKVPFGVVVFDAWYLAEDVVRVLARRRKDWVSLLKTNRLLETASFQLRDINGWAMKLPGPQIAVEELVPLIPANAYRPVTVGEHTYWCFTLRVRIPGLGKVRIVVSFETEQLTGRSVVLVANRVDWSAAKIIGLYLQRWPTETFYQDSKGQLGFNEYRMRSAEAIGKHWCLVFVAYSLLHLTCLPAVPDRTKHLIQSIGDACRQQGRALLQQLLVFVHDRLSSGAQSGGPCAAPRGPAQFVGSATANHRPTTSGASLWPHHPTCGRLTDHVCRRRFGSQASVRLRGGAREAASVRTMGSASEAGIALCARSASNAGAYLPHQRPCNQRSKKLRQYSKTPDLTDLLLLWVVGSTASSDCLLRLKHFPQ